MHLTNAIFIGLMDIWAHKFRSLLTMLGIVLGVSSLVAMAANIKGMENGMKESLIARGGLDKVVVSEEDVPEYQEYLSDQAPGQTIHDVRAIRQSAPLIRLVSPEMRIQRPVRVTRNGTPASTSEVVGVWHAVLDMNLYQVEHGRFLTDLDEEYANSVCVIGTGIRDQLFGSPMETGEEIIPIGELININGQPFTIVGMFKRYESEQDKRMREMAREQSSKNDSQGGVRRQRGWSRRNTWGNAFWRKNNVIYMPLNTAWIKFRSGAGDGGFPDPKLTAMDIKVKSLDRLEPALQQAKNVLMLTHNGIQDFEFRTQENSVEDINTKIRNARISGGIIAGLSLLVGGIGIMNIMLASINERVREIGTCKAIGATSEAIFIQILVESIAVALIGAALGIIASYGLVAFIKVMSPTQNAPVITTAPMILAVIFSALVGILAGLFPALKAARMNPIEALRYE